MPLSLFVCFSIEFIKIACTTITLPSKYYNPSFIYMTRKVTTHTCIYLRICVSRYVLFLYMYTCTGGSISEDLLQYVLKLKNYHKIFIKKIKKFLNGQKWKKTTNHDYFNKKKYIDSSSPQWAHTGSVPVYMAGWLYCVWANHFGHSISFIGMVKMVWKWFGMVWKKWCWMVWLCEFRGGINGWDLKILYRDLESWKKRLKKNRIEWNSL